MRDFAPIMISFVAGFFLWPCTHAIIPIHITVNYNTLFYEYFWGDIIPLKNLDV